MSPLEARYARALFEALPPGERLKAQEPLRAWTELFAGTPALWQALTSPCVRPEEKDALLRRLAEGSAPSVLMDFFRLLCQRGRIGLLPGVLREYRALCLEAENAAEGVVLSARPLPDGEAERLAAALCRKHGKSRVELRRETDPSLLGGFVLRLGDTVYDKSVRGMLDGLRRSLKEREQP